MISFFDCHLVFFLVIENLFRIRQNYPEVEAVYLITPNEKSIAALISDFAIRGKPMYKTAHVHFLMSKLFSYCYFSKDILDLNTYITKKMVYIFIGL